MPSLRSELAEISKRQDSWFGSASRKRTRTTTSDSRRHREKEPPGPPARKRRTKPENVTVVLDDDQVVNISTKSPDFASVEEDNRTTKLENCIVVADDEEVDRDYLDFLQILAAKEGNLDVTEPERHRNDEDTGNLDLIEPERDRNNKDIGNLDVIEPERGRNNEEDDEDMVDPDYKLFLDNAKQFGYSYVFEMKNADGTNLLIKYEEDIKKKKKPDVGTLRKQSKRIVNTLKQQNQQSRRVKSNVETLRQKKNPAVDTPRQQNQQNLVVKPNVEILRRKKNPTVDTPRQQNLQNLVVKPNVDAMGLQIPKIEPLDDNESGRGTRKGHLFLSDCKPEAIANADESYLKFLQHLWVTDGSLMYEHGDVVVMYEDYNEGVGIDCEQTGRRDSTFDNEKSLTPYPDQLTHLDEEGSDAVQILDDNSIKLHYKEKLNLKLREALQIPFNENELEEKLTAARDRKPLERTRIMRGRAVSYPTDRTSSSYLDLHPDLAGMLRSADQERSLALLRCLFFYYENVSHQGSFIPWRNPEGWLHEIICSCGETLNCPMKFNQSMEKEVWAEE